MSAHICVALDPEVPLPMEKGLILTNFLHTLILYTKPADISDSTLGFYWQNIYRVCTSQRNQNNWN